MEYKGKVDPLPPLTAVVLALTWVLFALGLSVFARYILTRDIAFDSDEFLHAAPALDFYTHLLRADWSTLISRVQRESFYPPLYPVFVMFSYLGFGPSLAASRAPSLIMFVITLLLVFYAVCRAIRCRKGSREEGILGGSLAVLFGVTCSEALFNSGLCMTEPLGMLIAAALLVAFSVLCGPQGETYSNRLAIVVGLLIAALLLTKYTFPLLVVPGVVFASCFSAITSWDELGRRFRWLLLAGIVAAVVVVGWFLWAERDGIYQYLFAYPARGYVIGINAVLYYPLKFLQHFTLFPQLGVLMLVLAVVAIIANWRAAVVRFAGSALLLSAVIMGLVSERSPRHIVVIAPFIWFLGGIGFARLLAGLQRFRSARWAGASLYGVITLAVAVSVAASLPWYERRVIRYMEQRPGLDPLLHALENRLDGGNSFIRHGDSLIGVSYNLDWRLAAKNSKTVYEITEATKVLAPEKEQSLISAVNQRSSSEVVRLLNEFVAASDAQGFLFTARLAGKKARLLDRIEAHVCQVVSCAGGRTETGRYLYIDAPTDDVRQRNGEEHGEKGDL